MKTLTTREAFRSLPRVAELAAESGGAPIVVTKGKPRRPFLVFLSFESAVRRGIVCRHGEEPAECPDCGPGGWNYPPFPRKARLSSAPDENEPRTRGGATSGADDDPPTLARALGADRQGKIQGESA